jgi:hypothetical protein
MEKTPLISGTLIDKIHDHPKTVTASRQLSRTSH